jgi:diguanylate cyclase (GGDEF)-like protein
MTARDARAKILIVDDEKINIDVLVGLLKRKYRTAAAKSGEQALRRLETPPLPDLILLDVMMPGMDGYEACRIVKSNPQTRDIPIIFITARIEEQDEVRGFQAGAVDYITKPFSPLTVLARVKTHIELKRRGDMLERMAGLDGLTGIPNRRRFDQVLADEGRRSRRYENPISVIMSDIDYFKRFNDHYGHIEGDACLRAVAEAIAGSLGRPEDLAARYGGEEFACILPESTNEGAMAVARRIMEKVRGLNLAHAASDAADHATLSIGAATCVPSDHEGPLSLVAAADKALYKAKEEGRNCVMGRGPVFPNEPSR